HLEPENSQVLGSDSLSSQEASPSGGKPQNPPGRAEAQGLPEVSYRAPKPARGLPWKKEPQLDSSLSQASKRGRWLQTTSPTYGTWKRPDGTKRTTKLMQHLPMGCPATEGAVRGGCHRRGNLTKEPRKKGKPPASGRQQFNRISQSEL
uniref:Uncharacterized protein n=1 Tax=Mustela putorius furo TaxID=9669 RepID=M3XZI0_MUSPF